MLRVPRSRDYRLFWSGSFVSNTGFWMQQIALGWLVYGMTRSASWLGAIGFAGNLPMLTLGLLGGAIADRASRRTIMLGTQGALAVTALVLAVLTASGHLTVWHVVVLAMLAGVASALYAPAMQSVIPALVEPGELLHAVSLNSVQFNLARTLGPALAGFVYAHLGPAGCFALNAGGFVVLTLLLARIHLPHRPAVAAAPLARALHEGLRYVRAHPVIGPALCLTAVMSLFGFPYIILLPALARDALGLTDASALGYLMAAVGAGAVIGGLALSAVGDLPHTGVVSIASAIGFGLTLTSFAVVRSVRGTAVLLFVMGVLQTACVASLNTTIQLAVHDRMRGRVMSMMSVMLFGFATVGGLVVGAIGDQIGVPRALAMGGIVITLAATAVLARSPALPAPVKAVG